jgi:hypothetical protein
MAILTLELIPGIKLYYQTILYAYTGSLVIDLLWFLYYFFVKFK